MIRRRQSLCAVVLAAPLAVLVLGGCGSSSKTEAADPVKDAAAAKTINIQTSDFPSGWTSAPGSPQSDQDKADDAKVNTCLGLPAPDQLHGDSVVSDDFTSNDQTLSSSVAFAKTKAKGKQQVTAFKSSKGADCFKQVLSDTFARDASGTTLKDVSVTSGAAPKGGDGGFSFSFTATVEAEGQQAKIDAEIQGVLVDRAQISLMSFTIGDKKIDAKLQQDLIDKMVARAKKA